MRIRRITAPLVASAAFVGGLALLASPAAAEDVGSPDCEGTEALVMGYRAYTIQHRDGTQDHQTWHLPDEPGLVRPGDTITVTFTVRDECVGTQMGFASYETESATFDPNEQQQLHDSATVVGSGETQSLTITVPMTSSSTSGGSAEDCPNKHQDGPETKDKGANTSGPYDSTCDGRPSGNGNGGGNADGRPCAGCVGNADDKNPKGQMPDADDDGDNGYECDGNKGIARENPAHTGCAQAEEDGFYQVDFFTGEVLDPVHYDGGLFYGPRLIDDYYGPVSA